MDYKNVFKNYRLIKNKVNKLLSSMDRTYVKQELDITDDDNLKKVAKAQYLYLLQKEMNLLKNNKSLLIIELEYNMRKIKNKTIEEIMKILNKLGYVDLLLLILNLDKDLVEKIKIATGNNSIEYNLLEEYDSEKQDEQLYNLISKISEDIFDKYNKASNSGSNNVNIIYRNENGLQDTSDINIENYEDEGVEEEDENDEEEDEKKLNIKNQIKKLIPTFVEKEGLGKEDVEKSGSGDGVSGVVVLSKGDMDLLEEL